MSRRHSIWDYPEHLNPFYEDFSSEAGKKKKKRSNSFSRSLKGLTNTIRRSFRAKSRTKTGEDDVQLRRSPASQISDGRCTLPANGYQRPGFTRLSDPQSYSPALPRSRFQERLAKSATLTKERFPPPPQDNNPFEEEERPHAKKRKKKKAPQPPQFQTIDEHLQVPSTCTSEWSLNSEDTSNYTPSEYSEDERIPVYEDSVEIQEKIKDFNENMQKLTDDTNNNVIVFNNEVRIEQASYDIPSVEVCYIDDSGNEESKEDCDTDEKSKSLEDVALQTKHLEINDVDPVDTSTPIPKLRKNKLTKRQLLGDDPHN